VLVDYFGNERCGLTDKVIENNIEALAQAKKPWLGLLKICFLNKELKEKYISLLENRIRVLAL